MKLERIRDTKAEIHNFSELEVDFFKMEKSFENAWNRYIDEGRDLNFAYMKEGEDVVGLLGYTVQVAGPKTSLAPEGTEFVFLMAIATKEGHFRKGIGSKLMEEFIEAAKKRNISFLSLRVSPTNDKAIALYKKFEFVEYIRNEKSVYMKKILRA